MKEKKARTLEEVLTEFAGIPPDSKSYRALALFLVFTTNPNFFDPQGSLDAIIAQRMQIAPKVVTKFRKKVVNAANLTYDDVRHDFLDLALSSGYSGPQCPKSFAALGFIADQYQ